MAWKLCRKIIRRKSIVVLITLLIILAILYHQLSKTSPIAPNIKLPQMPRELRKFLKESHNELKDSIQNLIRSQSASAMTMNEYFDNVGDDGFNLNWIHESEFHIPLKNESKSVLDLNSVMDSAGYIKTETLDSVVQEGRHGIHLSFRTLGQAKVALAAMTTRPEEIKAPVLISAKIMQGPNIDHCRKEKLCSYSEPVLLESLLALMKKEMKTQLGLSWTEYYDSKNVNRGYTWPIVVKMFETIREVKETEIFPLLFMVRAPLARLSIPQLKWLITVTKTKLVLEADPEDAKSDILPYDISLIYNFIPKSSVYLRIPQKLRTQVNKTRSTFTLSDEWKKYKSLAYKDEEWLVMSEADEKYFLRSEDSVLMYPSGNHPNYLGSANPMKLTLRKISTIVGRVVFFEDSEHLKTGNFKTGLNIFVGTRFDMIEEMSTAALIGANGYFSVSSYSTRRDVIMVDNKMTNVNPCYHFLLELEPRGIDMTLSSPVDCNYALDQKFLESLKIRLDITLMREPFNIFIKPVGKDSVLIDQFTWKE